MKRNLMTREVTIFTCVIFLMPIVACLAPTARGLAPSTDRKETNTIYRQQGRVTGQITIAVLRSDPVVYAKTVQRLREWQRQLVKMADLKIEIESQKFNAITISAPLLVVSSYPAAFERETFLHQLRAYAQRGGIVIFEQSDSPPFKTRQVHAIASDHPLLTHPFSFKSLPRQARPQEVFLERERIGFILGVSPTIAPFGPLGTEHYRPRNVAPRRPVGSDWIRSLKLGLNLVVFALDNHLNTSPIYPT
tara:strand:- start:853 stop:1599 length:747 start_codon:yes stop_codon:yes gene_type:complete